MTNRKLLLTVSLGILAAMIGAWVVIQNSESIKIQLYTWKLDSENETARKKAFEWLKTLAKKNLKDRKLKAFFKHPESQRQLESEGKKPLFSAVASGDFVNLMILLEHGANVNAKDYEGMTTLHSAAWFGKDKVARALIKHAAEGRVFSRSLAGSSLHPALAGVKS